MWVCVSAATRATALEELIAKADRAREEGDAAERQRVDAVLSRAITQVRVCQTSKSVVIISSTVRWSTIVTFVGPHVCTWWYGMDGIIV